MLCFCWCEIEVVEWIVEGKILSEIVIIFGFFEYIVNEYIGFVMRKFDVLNWIYFVMKVIRVGIIS